MVQARQASKVQESFTDPAGKEFRRDASLDASSDFAQGSYRSVFVPAMSRLLGLLPFSKRSTAGSWKW
jgi:hypothetical protein